MAPSVTYVIEFVGDMDRAVQFYRDVVGLPIRFQSPGWSEFQTGPTSFALHPASEKNPAGEDRNGVRGAGPPDVLRRAARKAVTFPTAPKKREYGGVLAQLQDSEGASVTVSKQQRAPTDG